MSTAAWSAFFPTVKPWLVDCPDLVIIDALRKAAREFCYRSQCWVVITDPVTVTADVSTYTLDPPTGTTAAHLLAVTYNGTKLDAKTYEQLDAEFPGWAAATGTPLYYFRPDDAEVQVVPVPTVTLASGLTTRLAVAPSILTSTGIDGDVFEKYSEPIASGAMARLLEMPGRKWSNPQLAGTQQSAFTAAIGHARATSYAGNSSAQLRARGSRFA